MFDAPPPPAAIALPSLFRLDSVSWRSVPFGPMRENRNGGVSATASAASLGSRPPTVSPRSPSPRTKKVSEPCFSMLSPYVELVANDRCTDSGRWRSASSRRAVNDLGGEFAERRFGLVLPQHLDLGREVLAGAGGHRLQRRLSHPGLVVVEKRLNNGVGLLIRKVACPRGCRGTDRRVVAGRGQLEDRGGLRIADPAGEVGGLGGQIRILSLDEALQVRQGVGSQPRRRLVIGLLGIERRPDLFAGDGQLFLLRDRLWARWPASSSFRSRQGRV